VVLLSKLIFNFLLAEVDSNSLLFLTIPEVKVLEVEAVICDSKLPEVKVLEVEALIGD